jgi:galactokinase
MARALLDAGHALSGWEGLVASDLPIGSGLSSSAALEMAVGLAFARVSGFPFDGVAMARLGQQAENDWVGARTGIMDQMVCANGEAGAALWIDCRSLAIRSVALPPGTAIVVMDTMTRHDHTTSGYNERRASCERAAAHLGVASLRDVSTADFERAAGGLDDVARRRARHVLSENDRVLAAVDAMRAGDAVALGRLMDASHESLREDFEVTNEALDRMVRVARSEPGCLGARMTGGGFGGCAIALVDAASAEAAAAAVARRYADETSLRPDVFVTRASAGTAVVG